MEFSISLGAKMSNLLNAFSRTQIMSSELDSGQWDVYGLDTVFSINFGPHREGLITRLKNLFFLDIYFNILWSALSTSFHKKLRVKRRFMIMRCDLNYFVFVSDQCQSDEDYSYKGRQALGSRFTSMEQVGSFKMNWNIFS